MARPGLGWIVAAAIGAGWYVSDHGPQPPVQCMVVLPEAPKQAMTPEPPSVAAISPVNVPQPVSKPEPAAEPAVEEQQPLQPVAAEPLPFQPERLGEVGPLPSSSDPDLPALTNPVSLYARLRVRIRAAPSPTAAAVATLEPGAEVKPGERRGDWQAVETANGPGWVRSDFLSTSPPAPSRPGKAVPVPTPASR